MQSAAVVVSISVLMHCESLNWISPFCSVTMSHTMIWPAPWSSTHVLNGSDLGRNPGQEGGGEGRRGGGKITGSGLGDMGGVGMKSKGTCVP